jgi:hypothetical protein
MASDPGRIALAAVLLAALMGGTTARAADPQPAAAAAAPDKKEGEKNGPDGGRPQMKEVDPNAPPPAAEEEEQAGFRRGAGGGLAILPAFLWWLLVVGWAATTVWAGKDEAQLKSFTPVWLPILAFPFFVVALCAWWIPFSLVAAGITAAGWLGTFVPYAVLRDRALPADQRLLSVQNAGLAVARQLQPLLRRVGIKIDLESRSLAVSLPDVEITAQPVEGGSAPEARLAEAAASEGYGVFRELVQRCIAMRAERALVEITQQGATVRQLIDGVWQPLRVLVKRRAGLKTIDEFEPAEPIGKEQSRHLVATLKTLCGISVKGGKREAGSFLVTLQRRAIPCGVVLEKSESTLRMMWDFQPSPMAFKSLTGLGMEEADAARLSLALALVNSLVVVSAPDGQGLTTTFARVVLAADRLLRDFVLLEDERTPFRELQNVKPFRWGGPDKLAPSAVLETAMRGYPTAIVVPLLDDGPLAEQLAKQAGEMLVIVGVRANDAVEAVEKLLALGMPRAELARTLQVATGQRLIRRVCPKCAQDLELSADKIARLKLPAQEGRSLKKAAAGGCPACSGTGYLGRAAVFELLGGPTVSKAIAKGVDRATLVKAAQADDMRRFKETGLTMVAAGTTTLEELQRILTKEKG